MTATELADALEKRAAVFTAQARPGWQQEVTLLSEAARMLRAVGKALPSLEHTYLCDSRGAGADNGLSCTCERGKITCPGCRPCDCGLDDLLRAARSG